MPETPGKVLETISIFKSIFNLRYNMDGKRAVSSQQNVISNLPCLQRKRGRVKQLDNIRLLMLAYLSAGTPSPTQVIVVVELGEGGKIVLLAFNLETERSHEIGDEYSNGVEIDVINVG